MDAVDRDPLIDLLAQALMRDSSFRPRRRNWAADADRCCLEARTCAAGLVEHLYRCKQPLITITRMTDALERCRPFRWLLQPRR